MRRVLIIERSATLRHILGTQLQQAGFALDAATSYSEGQARLEVQPYDAVALGWPPKTDPGCDELLALLEEPRARGIAVLIMAHQHESALNTWIMRRKRATAVLWDNHGEAVSALGTLLATPEGDEPPTPRSISPDDAQIRILFVDDSPSVRVYFRRLLARHGYATEVAACGEEALELASSRTFDIGIIDYFMPDAKGDEVCRRLRDHSDTADITCAIITSTYLDQVIKDALDAGAVECMFKNESDALFLARVDAMSRLIRTQKSIVAERERLAGILSSVGEGVYGVDQGGRITFLNPAACRILGFERSGELIGESAQARFHYAGYDGSPLPPEHCTLHQAYGCGEEVRSWETIFWHRRGDPIPVECTVYPLQIQGRQEGSVVAFRDISERKRLEERLRWQATHDPLTELVNRRYFEEELQREVQRLRRADDERAALLYIDLDRFKYINDTMGHTAGDELLIEVGHQLRERLRDGDVLARIGGDEFGVLLRDVDEDEVYSLAESFRSMLEQCNFTFGGRSYKINGTVGVAAFDFNTVEPEEVLANADIACHLAKRKGRNQTHVYHPEQDERTAMDFELGWSARLRESLEHDRFLLYYQPIAPLAVAAPLEPGQEAAWSQPDAWPGQCPAFYEVLIRLIGSHNEVVAPDAFLSSAERFNLMQDIDRWVLRHALAGLAELNQRGSRTAFSINLSGQTLNDQGLRAYVEELLEEYALDPGLLVFEITETAAIANIKAAQTFIAAMRELGCRFALDDFGSGFSSFSHLKHLPADYIKIDGMFVQGMVRDPIDRAMVSSVNDIAHSLGRQTIAEYVETPEILESLRTCGVDYVQGYHIARPLPQLEPNVSETRQAPSPEPWHVKGIPSD